MPDGEFKRFKGFAVKFLLRDGVLYRHAKTGMPPRRVLGNAKDKEEVLKTIARRIRSPGERWNLLESTTPLLLGRLISRYRPLYTLLRGVSETQAAPLR